MTSDFMDSGQNRLCLWKCCCQKPYLQFPSIKVRQFEACTSVCGCPLAKGLCVPEIQDDGEKSDAGPAVHHPEAAQAAV